jgi:hypothetical protein
MEPARRTILQRMVPGTVPTVEKAMGPKTTLGTKTVPECDEVANPIAVLNPARVVPEAVEKAADVTDQNRQVFQESESMKRRTKTMKKVMISIFLICALCLPFVSSSFAQRGGQGNGSGGNNQGQPGACEMIAAMPTEPLNSAEIEALQWMREEEKLARDVYLTLGETWGLRVFENIAASEQRHMDAVLTLINRYDEVADPVVADSVGAFSNQTLAGLYTDLVNFGNASVVNALLAGAEIEELDIADLIEALEETDNADIQFVYENLLQGSANHYASFSRLLEAHETVYELKIFTVEELEAILSAIPEKGRRGKGSNSLSRGGRQGRGSAQGPRDGSGPGQGECPFGN